MRIALQYICSIALCAVLEQIPWGNSSVFDDFYFRIPANAAAAKAQAKKGPINSTFVAP